MNKHPGSNYTEIVYNVYVNRSSSEYDMRRPFLVLIVILFFPLSSHSQQRKSMDFDPDDPPETTIQIAPYLTFGGQLEFEYKYERNFDLDKNNDEDVSSIEPGLGIAFSFDPAENFQAFLAATFFWEFLFEDGEKNSDMTGLEIEQAYLLYSGIYYDGLSLQLGRQRFEDEREWLFDEELDAVRIFYNISYLTTSFSVSRWNLLNRDLLNSDEEDRINNYLLRSIYAVDNDDREFIASLYVFFRDDRSDDNESPVFIGFQSSGDLVDNIAYWLELSFILGKDGSQDIRAFGTDLGLTYEFDLPFEPSVTLGFAFGSGDDNHGGNTTSEYRQTGFQNNESSFNGAVDFSYYGEVFDPELSNMFIFTAGAGFNLTGESSVDLIYHYYMQHKRSESFRDVGIDIEPEGNSRSIGNEIDLVLGYEELWNTELALRFGYFIPGSAFQGTADNAFSALIEFQYELR